MNYQETLRYLFDKLPMYQKVGKVAFKKDLKNTFALLKALDNPHEKFKSVHIAGTNGKGTCAHGIAAIMQHAGYKTGLYTSPHLKNFTERIKIDGSEVDEAYVVRFVQKIKHTIEVVEPSFFEITVAMAFDYFAAQSVDIAIIETGLGGRLDSTNVITPQACLITNIGFDHMDMLGDTLEKIAAEKAGIIKKGVPVVIGEYHPETLPVFMKKAKEVGARIYLDYDFGLKNNKTDYPFHKALNFSSVNRLAHVLREQKWELTDQNILEGYDQMENLTGLKGRFQLLHKKPNVILDVSHNEPGLTKLFHSLSNKLPSESKLHLIFGTVKGKALPPLFELFPKTASFYWTQSSVPRSLPVEMLSEQGYHYGFEGNSYNDVNAAIDAAIAASNHDDTVLVTGSTFVVAEVKGL